jgi:type I restriction enzyme S subunit
LKIETHDTDVVPEFLYYYMAQHDVCQWLEQHAVGSTMLNLSAGIVNDMPVHYPLREQQERIAETLTAYDDLMENNRRRMALLEESARLLYREWYVHLRFPGHEHTRRINGVPQGWERKTLHDICTDIRESVSPEELETDTPYIGLEHIPRRSISLTDWGVAADVTSSKNRFVAGDILFGKIRPYFHKVGIAFTDGVASSDAIVIRPHEERLLALTLMTVSSDDFVAEASQSAREGSKMPRADWKLMLKYPVFVPPRALLNSFNESVTDVTAQLKNLCFQTQKLRTARDLLLPRLMSGEIEV